MCQVPKSIPMTIGTSDLCKLTISLTITIGMREHIGLVQKERNCTCLQSYIGFPKGCRHQHTTFPPTKTKGKIDDRYATLTP